MTDEERLNPTVKSRVVEWGKIAGAVSAIIVCSVSVWGLTFGPVRDAWVIITTAIETAQDLQKGQIEMNALQQATVTQLAGVVEQQTDLLARVEVLESGRRQDRSPAIQFMRNGSAITDAAPGGTVRITWAFLKLRDCGRPTIDLLFKNGGGRFHRFRDVSVLDDEGRGVAVDPDPTNPQTISYTARIPADDGVEPGIGFGFVRVSYPEACPDVASVKSPEVFFTILPS